MATAMFYVLQSVLLGYVLPGLEMPSAQMPLGKMEGLMVRLVLCSQTDLGSNPDSTY